MRRKAVLAVTPRGCFAPSLIGLCRDLGGRCGWCTFATGLLFSWSDLIAIIRF